MHPEGKARAPELSPGQGLQHSQHSHSCLERLQTPCRFLKTPGEIIQEKSSRLEQLENEEHEELREKLLEVSVQDTTEGCECSAVQGDLCSAGKCQHLLLSAQKAAEGVLDSKSCLDPKL